MANAPQAVIAHCDANSFYCSCHRVFEPSLLGTPLGVLSNNDGCVIARTPELKALGIGMGTPFFQIKPLLEQGIIAIRSSNYPLYGDMSARFISVLEQFTPEVEVYSIDEAFLRFDGFAVPHWDDKGREIQQQVKRWTGLPIGVGIATTKTLAKLANYAAKHYSATSGVVDLTQPERQRRLMALTPIDEIWGIGRRLAQRLKHQGTLSALDLANREPAQIRRQFSVTEERLVRELRGESCLPWQEQTTTNKYTIMCSRSFGQPVSSLREIKAAVATFVSRACEKLRQQGKVASKAQLFIRTSPYYQQNAPYQNAIIVELVMPSASTQAWLAAASQGLEQLYQERMVYHKAGFILLDLRPQTLSQHDLFHGPSTFAQSIEPPALTATIDTINARYGAGTIRLATCCHRRQRWPMKQNYLSPRFTTRWNELLVVKCV